MLNILVLLYKKTGQSRSLLFIIHKIKHELFFPSQWSKKAATSADCRCIINFPTIGTHARRALRTRLSTGLVIKLKVFEKPHNFSWAIIQYQYRGRTCAPARTEPRSHGADTEADADADAADTCGRRTSTRSHARHGTCGARENRLGLSPFSPPPPRSNPVICLHARKTDSLDKSISPEIRSR